MTDLEVGRAIVEAIASWLAVSSSESKVAEQTDNEQVFGSTEWTKCGERCQCERSWVTVDKEGLLTSPRTEFVEFAFDLNRRSIGRLHQFLGREDTDKDLIDI